MTLIVNGEKIDDSLIQQEVQHLRPDYERVFKDQSRQQREAQLLEWSRENVIEQVLINQYAKKHGEPIPQQQIDAAFTQMKKQYQTEGQPPEKLNAEDERKIKQAIELQMKIKRLLQDVCKDIPNPSKEDISKFYQENKEQFTTTEQIRVAHIVKHINLQSDNATAYNAIKSAQDELKKGTAFELLVQKYSDCPDNAGDLGYIKKGQMVEEFEDVVFNLGTGEVSDIFRTRFGFHIAKLFDRKPAAVPGLDKVKNQIINELREQTQRKAVDEFVDKLKDKAIIEETS